MAGEKITTTEENSSGINNAEDISAISPSEEQAADNTPETDVSSEQTEEIFPEQPPQDVSVQNVTPAITDPQGELTESMTEKKDINMKQVNVRIDSQAKPQKQNRTPKQNKAKKNSKKHSGLFASAAPAKKENTEKVLQDKTDPVSAQIANHNTLIIGKSGGGHEFRHQDPNTDTSKAPTFTIEQVTASVQPTKKKKSRFQLFMKRMRSTDPKYDEYKENFYNGYKFIAGTAVAVTLIVTSISATAGIWSLRGKNSGASAVSPVAAIEQTESARSISVSARNRIEAEKDTESVSYKITVKAGDDDDKLQDVMDKLEEIAKENSLNGSDGYDMKDNGNTLIFSLKGLPTSQALTIQSEIENNLFKRGFDYETTDPKYSASTESVKKAYKDTVSQTIKDAESDAKYVAKQKNFSVGKLTGIDVSTETVGKDEYVVVNAEYAVK